MIERAILIALESHWGQKDKGGKPYILHVLHVASRMRSEEEIQAAVLHDSVEDKAQLLAQKQNPEIKDNLDIDDQKQLALDYLSNTFSKDCAAYIKSLTNPDYNKLMAQDKSLTKNQK